MLAVITASIAWILFNSSAEIASSIICLSKRPRNVSTSPTSSHAPNDQATTAPTKIVAASSVAAYVITSYRTTISRSAGSSLARMMRLK